MALFGKLFEKKTCDICDGDIGILGNRKLEDGNLCKKCAAKLSPYFDERRHSTVEQIREQLNYREANQREVNNFHATRVLGKDMKIFLDETNGRFIVSRNRDFQDSNPDIIDITKMTSINYKIDEYHTEEKKTERDNEGHSKQVSYNPPHYNYGFNFRMTIGVDSPYFDEIHFDVNGPTVNVKTVGLIDDRSARTSTATPVSSGNGILNIAKSLVNALTESTDPRMSNPEYVEYLNISNEIKDTLLQVRDRFMGITPRETEVPQQSVQEQPAAPVSNAVTTCPYCGSKVTSPTAAFCEFCGGRF